MPDSAPALAAAPSTADLESVEDPAERARQITAIGRHPGTLPPELAILRVRSLREAREAGWAVAALADYVDLTPSRVSALTVGAAGAAILAEG